MMNASAHPLQHGLLHHIVQLCHEAMVVVSVPDLNILEINQAACKLIGGKREEFLGSPLFAIECALQDVFFWEELRAAPELTETRVAESEWLCRDGSSIPVEKRVSSYRDGEQIV